MQKFLSLASTLVFLLSALSFAESFPEGFKGPGGCDSPEACKQYCTTHQEECRGFQSPQQTMPDKGEMMQFPYESKDMPRPPQAMMQGLYPDKGMSRPPQMAQGMMYPMEMDPIEMAMSGMFMQMKNMDPMEFKQYCPDAEKMVDAAIAKMKEQGIELKPHCDEAQKMVQMCKEQGNRCENFKTHPILDKDFLRCDVSEEQFFKECMEGNKQFTEGKNIDEQCERQFAPMKESCEKNKQMQCGDEQSFMQRCISDQEQYCKRLGEEQKWTQEQLAVCFRSHTCGKAWESQKERCQQPLQKCDKEAFMQECRERMSKGFETAQGNQEERCRQQATQLRKHAEENCKVGDEMHKRCVEERQKQCSRMEEALTKCSSITPEQIRARMVEQARKMCKMMARYQEGKGGMDDVMIKMMQMRGSLPADGRMRIDMEIKNLDEVHQEIAMERKSDNIIMRFLQLIGLLKKERLADAQQLRNSAIKIKESIDRLTALSEQSDEITKNVLQEQISQLSEQQKNLEAQAVAKEESGDLLSGSFISRLPIFRKT